MANGDDFTDRYGFDPNPPGTVTPLGLGPNDPLIDWGSNLKPADVQRFIHDPEGAKQDMINKGVPPPPVDYQHDGRGTLAPVTRGLGVVNPLDPNTPETTPPTIPRPPVHTPVRDPSQGNLTDEGPILGQPKGPLAPVVEGIKKGLREGWKPTRPEDLDPFQAQGGGGATPYTPQPPAKVAPLPPATNVGPYPQERGETVPLPRPRPEDADTVVAQAETDRKKREEALSEFAKSLQGVKVPVRPPLPAPGVVTPRGPVGVTPNVQQLLALAGTPGGVPSTPPNALARLLGRLG